MVDMARSEDEIREKEGLMSPSVPTYPYGLSICLTDDELAKLDLDSDCEVGDLLHMVSMCKVTSISKNDTPEGSRCRIELQIIDIEVLENENEEYEEDEQPKKSMTGMYKRMYQEE